MKVSTDLLAHAAAHYEEDGWDVLVECYSEEEIDEELEANNIDTLPEAIAYFGAKLGVHNEIREDIEGEAF